MQIINNGAVRKIKTYALEHADEERDHIFCYHLTSFSKMLAQSHVSVLGPKPQFLGERTKRTFIKHLLLSLNIKYTSHH